MEKKLMLLFVIFVAIGCAFCEEKAIQEKIVAEKIPDDYVFIDIATTMHFHPFKKAAVCWPSVKEIAESKIAVNKDAAQKAISETMEWLKRILSPEWVPEQSSIDFFPMKAYIQKCDAIYCRYKIKNYAFQIISTSWSMIVIVKDISRNQLSESIEINNAQAHVSTVLDMFVQKSDKIKTASMTKVIKTANGVKGTPDMKSSLPAWWNLVSWWTDGNTVMLGTCKADGGPSFPGGQEVWFSNLPSQDKGHQ